MSAVDEKSLTEVSDTVARAALVDCVFQVCILAVPPAVSLLLSHLLRFLLSFLQTCVQLLFPASVQSSATFSRQCQALLGRTHRLTNVLV